MGIDKLGRSEVNRLSLHILVSGLMILTSVSMLSTLSHQAIEAGYDGTVIDDIWSSKRLLVLGVGGSILASELIYRGEGTVIKDVRYYSDRKSTRQSDAATNSIITSTP